MRCRTCRRSARRSSAPASVAIVRITGFILRADGTHRGGAGLGGLARASQRRHGGLCPGYRLAGAGDAQQQRCRRRVQPRRRRPGTGASCPTARLSRAHLAAPDSSRNPNADIGRHTEDDGIAVKVSMLPAHQRAEHSLGRYPGRRHVLRRRFCLVHGIDGRLQILDQDAGGYRATTPATALIVP